MTDFILAIDPGDLTGWATLEFRGGDPIEMEILELNEFFDKLNNLDPTGLQRIIMEDYVIFHKKAQAHAGSRVKAIQVIGAVKAYAAKHEVLLYLQRPDILPIAAKWSGVVQPSNHRISHDVDAFNHGFYYLCKVGLAKTQAERR